MKTVLMALLGSFALITTGRGQFPSFGSGLYRSVEDFRNNHRFHDLLDAQIQDGDLTAYDAMHHMTKLNWLLRQSQTTTVSH